MVKHGKVPTFGTKEGKGLRGALFALLLACAGLALWVATGASAQTKVGSKPAPSGGNKAPLANQVIASTPMAITVSDDTSMDIRYTNPTLGQNEASQFYGPNSEGVFLWVNIDNTIRVFGPQHVPYGNEVNPYIFVSNTKSGSGTPSDPFVVTTRVLVPGTYISLIQRATYVAGSEFVPLTFELSQPDGTPAIPVTLFHAADLYTAGSDSGYGYYDASSGGVGDYITPTNASRPLYQQFVPSTPATHHMEGLFQSIWDHIGSINGPGPGFDDTVAAYTLHDSGAGLQWNLTVPAGGSVTVGDTDLFSPHQALCGAFSDVHYYDYYYDYIYYLACHNIVNGYGDTTFRPQNNISRGQLSKIVANSAGFSEPPATQIFQDVPPSSPFYAYIQRMASRGIIGGYPCGYRPDELCMPGSRPYFRVNENASRGQIAKIVSNAAGLNSTPTGQTFSDVPSSSPYYTFVERLVRRGTMGGYPCGSVGEPCDTQNRPYFRTNNNATRAQTAKIDALTFFPTCCP